MPARAPCCSTWVGGFGVRCACLGAASRAYMVHDRMECSLPRMLSKFECLRSPLSHLDGRPSAPSSPWIWDDA
eukprot:13058070-Alexandrium_andersonii.AAC.1